MLSSYPHARGFIRRAHAFTFTDFSESKPFILQVDLSLLFMTTIPSPSRFSSFHAAAHAAGNASPFHAVSKQLGVHAKQVHDSVTLAGTQAGKNVLGLVRQPMTRLSLGVALKLFVPVACLFVPVFRVPLAGYVAKTGLAHVAGRSGKKLLGRVKPHQLDTVGKRLYFMAVKDYKNMFSNPAEYREFVLNFNRLNKELLGQAKLPKKALVQVAHRLPFSPKAFTWIKHLPFVGKNVGSWLHKRIDSLYALKNMVLKEQDTPMFNQRFKQQVYKNFIRIHPDQGFGRLARETIDLGATELNDMFDAANASSFTDWLWTTTRNKVSTVSQSFATQGFNRGVATLARFLPFGKPISRAIRLMGHRFLPMVRQAIRHLFGQVENTVRSKPVKVA